MPAERLAMRRVREILKYRFEEGLGHKAISYRVGAAPSTVRETLRRAEAAGLVWPLDDEITDAVLEAALYKANGTKTGHRRSVEPDWAHVHRKLKRKHVTLQILWDEYIARHPGGYRYSRFCDLYKGGIQPARNDAAEPCRRRQALRRLCRRYGDGDRRPAEGQDAPGASVRGRVGRFEPILAEGHWSETLPDWLGCHVNALEAFGGAPALLVPDNAKVAIIKACRYDPQVNRTYAGMTSIMAVRCCRPDHGGHSA